MPFLDQPMSSFLYSVYSENREMTEISGTFRQLLNLQSQSTAGGLVHDSAD